MKKLSFVIALLVIFSFFTLPVYAEEKGYAIDTTEEITAEAIYLYSLDDNSVIHEKNANQARPPASLTKIMTAILAIEKTLEKNSTLDTEMVTYPTSVQDFLFSYQLEHGAVSSGNLVAGETRSMREYLYALMLPSANEAALTIAEHIGGSQEAFLEMMNKRAEELGATSTHFENPNGLYAEGHVSSAHDMALFALHAMTLPDFTDISSTLIYEAGPSNKSESLTWKSTNSMMDPESTAYYNPYVKGIKTGTLEESGRCFVSTATKNGFNYLLVVMGSTYVPNGTIYSFTDSEIIYDWVFSSFAFQSLEKGSIVDEIPVNLSKEKDFVHLVTSEHFSTLMPNNIEFSSVTKDIDIPESIDAPIAAGQKIGTVTFVFSGKEIGTVDLLASEAVNESKYLVFMEKVKAITKTFWFKLIVAVIVVLIVGYIALMVIRSRNRRLSENRRRKQMNYKNRNRRP